MAQRPKPRASAARGNQFRGEASLDVRTLPCSSPSANLVGEMEEMQTEIKRDENSRVRIICGYGFLIFEI